MFDFIHQHADFFKCWGNICQFSSKHQKGLRLNYGSGLMKFELCANDGSGSLSGELLHNLTALYFSNCNMCLLFLFVQFMLLRLTAIMEKIVIGITMLCVRVQIFLIICLRNAFGIIFLFSDSESNHTVTGLFGIWFGLIFEIHTFAICEGYH